MKRVFWHSAKEDVSRWTGCYLGGKKTLRRPLSVGTACADLCVCGVTATFFWDQTSGFWNISSSVLAQRGPGGVSGQSSMTHVASLLVSLPHDT